MHKSMAVTSKHTFTVFTPTYNRVEVLHRVYESLRKQTFRDFEWLIVDDGSQDATGDLVGAWVDEGRFPIRYVKKENGGKHSAFNRGVREASGRLFLTLDSDDACVPEALERLYRRWSEIPEEHRERYAGITVLCRDEEGRVVGDLFPEEVFDATTYDLHYRLGVHGEKWGFVRTELLRQHPYPEYPGERHVPPGYVWLRIGHTYLTRYVNEALRIYYTTDVSITRSLISLRSRSPLGSRDFYAEVLKYPGMNMEKIKAAVNYVRYSLHAGIRLMKLLSGAPRPFLILGGLLPGLGIYLRDKRVTG